MAQESQATSFIFFVGETHAGKSSAIRLLTHNAGVKVAASKSTESTTKDVALYRDYMNHDWQYVDTQGTDDSAAKEDDETIRLKAAKELMKMQFEKKHSKLRIKFVWVCTPNEVAKGSLKKAAEFIRKFGEDAWEATLLVIREPASMERASQGPLEAARCFGAKDVLAVGYHCIQWKDQGDSVLELVLAQEPAVRKQKHRYFTEAEMEEDLRGQIAKLKYIPPQFNVQECEKCGMKGDPDFTHAPCHPKIKRQHSDLMTHDGPLDDVTQTTYSHGKIERTCPKGHFGGEKEKVTSGSYQCKTCYGYRDEGEEVWHCYICCDYMHLGSKHDVDCNGVYCFSTASCPTPETCTNCRATSALGIGGCLSTTVLLRREYRCCRALEGREGCKYSCCKKSKGSEPCTFLQYCPTCDKKMGKSGCSMEAKHLFRATDEEKEDD